MNKKTLVKKIVQHLVDELALYSKAARAAHAEATHEQSKAENKYDTRGLEASYLARGQSRQAAETEQALQEFQQLKARSWAPAELIDIGALVELEGRGDVTLYFMGPRAGGTEIIHEKKEVLVITPQSPLGQELVTRRQGDRFQMVLGGSRDEYRVVSVA